MNWLAAKLSDVAPSKPLKVEGIDEEQQVWQVNLNHIESNTGKLLEKDIQPYSMAGSSTHWFDERHVLYSKLRPYLNKVLLPSQRGVGTTELVPMLPNEKRLNRKFLAYYLRSKDFVDWVSTQTAGAKMPRVSMKVFWEHKIPLPPLEEQKKVATILDAADRLRQKNAQLIAKYNALSQSLFLDMFGDPVTNPMGWAQVAMKDCLTNFQNGIGKNKEFYGKGEKVANISDLYASFRFTPIHFSLIDVTTEETEKYRINKGDILFVRSSVKREGVAVCSFYDSDDTCLFGSFMIKATPDAKKISPCFASMQMRCSSYRKLIVNASNTATITNISQPNLKRLPLIIPPLTLQNQFAERLQAIEAQKQQAQASLQKSEELFNSLLQRAFKGELTAC